MLAKIYHGSAANWEVPRDQDWVEYVVIQGISSNEKSYLLSGSICVIRMRYCSSEPDSYSSFKSTDAVVRFNTDRGGLSTYIVDGRAAVRMA
jgi:hypothetical protein